MEFGPRALGNRSILGDARSPTMQKTLNLKVKHRESFRPFAPSVLREDVADWFALDRDSPYMLLTADVSVERRKPPAQAQEALFGIDRLNVPRSDIPAVTHVDYSARVQTRPIAKPPPLPRAAGSLQGQDGLPGDREHQLQRARRAPSSVPRRTPSACFMGTDLDCLAIGHCFLRKTEQDPSLKRGYAESFEPD